MPDLTEPQMPLFESMGHELCFDCLCCKICQRKAGEVYDTRVSCCDRTNIIHFCRVRRLFGKEWDLFDAS